MVSDSGMPAAAIAPATLLLAGLLLRISWVDARTMRIPDGLNAALLASGLGVAALSGWQTLADAAASAGICFALMWAVARGYCYARGRPGLGGGDVKLAAAGGAWIGLGPAPMALLVACLAALVWSLISGVGATSLTRKIAFGPFLALGIGSVWILERWAWP